MKYKLSEIMDMIGGGTPKTSNPDYWNGDIPWLSVKDFGNDYRYVYESEKHITKLGLENSSTKLLQRGDIIISARGTVGEIATIPYPMAFNQSCYGLRAKKEIVTEDFLYYLIKHSVRILKRNTHGSVFDTITRDTFETIEVDVPSISDQIKIASILGDLDSKIELNNRINNNLAEQAVSLFRRYYDQATDEVCFTDLIQILGGGTPKTTCEAYWNGEIPFFTPKDVGTPYVLSTEKHITENGLANCNSRLYPINTVFVTARGTVGKISMPGIPMAMNQSCYALVGKNIPQLLVYFYTLQTVAKLKHKAMGAVFDAITTRDFETEQVRRLDNAVANEFIGVVEPIYKQILSLSMENQKLVELRDAILPKLMSGDIDLSVVKT